MMKASKLGLAVRGTLGLWLIGCAGVCSAETPFVMMRMTTKAQDDPARQREIISINAARPGSADAYWMCPKYYLKAEEARADFVRIAAFRRDLEKADIRLDVQQGETLGHGAVSTNQPAFHPFSDDVWQIAADGARQPMLCPRSPEVLAYEENWIAELCRIAKPGAIWLDDDLRMGYGKERGCFCDRCLKAFNGRFGHSLSREELAAKLFGKTPREAVRREWLAFTADAVAQFGAAARRGADRGNPETEIAYQSVNAASLLAVGRTSLPLLAALSGKDHRPTGIRIGSESYFEDADALSWKMMSVIRESERCRASRVNVGQICYEQENFTREILHKSADAALVESALALACGCDSLSEYRCDSRSEEPLSDYAEFATLLAAYRPYLLRLGELSRTTVFGGVARFVGSDCDLTPDYDLLDPLDTTLADLGVPVTVAEAGPRLWYVTARTVFEWGNDDAERLLAGGAGAVVDSCVWEKFQEIGGARIAAAVREGRLVKHNLSELRHAESVRRPTTADRQSLLDAFDRVGKSRACVRVDRTHRFRVLPRLRRADDRTVAVTLWNESAGSVPSTVVRIRHPAARYAVWARPLLTDQPLYLRSCEGDEVEVVVPSLPGRQIGTILLLDACPETAADRTTITGERAYLPRYSEGGAPWQRGYRPNAVRMWEVAAQSAMLTGTVSVVAADGRVLRSGIDYRVEPTYGAIGLIGAAADDPAINPVSLSYVCRQERLDAWFVNADGRIDCVRGVPCVTRARVPQLPAGAKLLGHFYVRGGARTDDGLFFRAEGLFVPPEPLVSAEKAMPKTLAKLRAGDPVTILAWGDSVTQCSYLHTDDMWQNRLVRALESKFPRAKITLVSEGWGGRRSVDFLDAPAGSPHGYVEKVLDVRPDLVISEFANDGAFDAGQVKDVYGRILADFRVRGIEWVAFAPSYVMPSWMGLGSMADCDADPRPYVKALKEFAVAHGIGLADCSAHWGHLWREGLPYAIYFTNGVNHPDAEAMNFFVEAFFAFLQVR